MVKSKKRQKNFDEYVTNWMGSVPSILAHTFLFILFLIIPIFSEIKFEQTLLILTTIVSLEAIYLALFIQISINRQTLTIEEVSEDIEEIQEDVEDIQEDMEEIQEDVEEVTKNVDELSDDVEEVSKDLEEISEDIEEIQEDVEEIQEDMEEDEKEEETEEEKEAHRKADQKVRLEKIENILEKLLKDIHDIRK